MLRHAWLFNICGKADVYTALCGYSWYDLLFEQKSELAM